MKPINVGAAPPILIWRRDRYSVSTDKQRLDLDLIHAYLHRSYWSPGIPRAVVADAIHNSFCFGLYCDETDKQIGYARIVTDYATLAYMADVFVVPNYRGEGLGVWLINCVVNAPPLASIRAFYLATRDAHGLYERFGFETPSDPKRIMVARFEMPWYQPDLSETHEEDPLQ